MGKGRSPEDFAKALITSPDSYSGQHTLGRIFRLLSFGGSHLPHRKVQLCRAQRAAAPQFIRIGSVKTLQPRLGHAIDGRVQILQISAEGAVMSSEADNHEGNISDWTARADHMQATSKQMHFWSFFILFLG